MSDSDDAMGVNPYEIALGKVSSIFPPAPYNYRYRAGVQLALCCVLIALALAYVVLRVAHARSSGTPLWLFKLERGTTRRSARRVKINQMPVFAVLALLAGVAQLATRIYTWRLFVQGHPPLHYISAQVLPWLPPFTQAWFFSFTNLQATLAVRGTIGSRWRRTLPPVAHNTVLLGFPLAFMAVVTPMTVITSATENKVNRLCYALIPQLQDASSIWKSGGLPSAAINSQLLAEKIQIIASTNELVQRIVQLCSVFLAVVSLICLMNLGTLCLVCTLRSTVAADRRRAQENFLENCQPQITSSAPVMQIAQTGNPLGKNNQPTLSHESSGEKLGQIHAPVAFNPTPPMHLCPQTVAMRRLAADLSTTIPCILALALTILVELAILVNRRFMNMTWALQEFTMDSFCYAYCFFNILALSFLIYNLVHAWRAQQAIDPLSTDTKNGESGLRHGRSQVTARKVIVSLVPPARSGSCEEVKSKERVECQ